MSVVRQSSPTVDEYIAVFEDEISSSLAWGRSGDWNKLRRRLDALAGRLRDAAAANTRSPHWAYHLEHALWVEVLPEALLPGVLEELVETLRSQRRRGEADPGVWASLDRMSFEDERKRYRRQEAFADAAVLAALTRHVEDPSHLRILEGLQALEDLHAARLALAPTFGEEQLVTEGKRMAEALRALLPSTARRLLSSGVENVFRAEVERKPMGELGPPAPFWHHKIPDVGVWYPIWTEVPFGSDEPDPFGVWFIESFQRAYAEWHAEAEARRTRRREKEERGLAHPMEERRHEEDRRARETLQRDEEARRSREEREQQAALEQAREQALRGDAEGERHRRADIEAQREAERAKAKQHARQERALRPPERDYWKRRPEQIQRRQADDEWERWCKSKGVSPDEAPDDVRERFMSHI